jgi:HEAT repeat protein
VVIKRSASELIARLTADLSASNEVQREAAIARLAVIGRRAVPHLLAALGPDNPRQLRMSSLRALEGIGEEGDLGAVLGSLADPDPDIAAAAVAVVRRFLQTGCDPIAVDQLTALVLDPGRDVVVRRAALEALGEMPARTVRPVWERLSGDQAFSDVAARASLPQQSEERETAAAQIESAAAATPVEPSSLRAALKSVGGSIPLPTLHRLVGALRARESGVTSAKSRSEWLGTRAEVHQVLATRGSRVALYDVRETLAQADGPLPVGFLAALGAIGDASCLEPIAIAYSRAGAVAQGPGDWWRQHLKQTFREIIERERLTRRHAAVRRVALRWPDVAKDLLPVTKRSS